MAAMAAGVTGVPPVGVSFASRHRWDGCLWEGSSLSATAVTAACRGQQETAPLEAGRRETMIRVLFLVVILSACSPDSGGDNGGDAGGYQAEYGGSASVYAQIAADTDCDSLQETFDRASTNHDSAEPGSDEAQWSTGYMSAVDDRMQAIGCY